MYKQISAAAVVALGVAVFQGAGVSPAQAQDATYLTNDASACEIFRALSRIVPNECAKEGDRQVYLTRQAGSLSRSLVRVQQAAVIFNDSGTAIEPVAESIAAAEQAAPPKQLAAALRVEFAFDSAELTWEAKQVLDRVATVINNDLMDRTYLQIEGHADARGTESYNLELSQERALAVRGYLIERHGVDGSKLMARGKGESEPFDQTDPFAGINRRVEFVNLTG